jgi:tetratricopeptide (TPR) repeat protein
VPKVSQDQLLNMLMEEVYAHSAWWEGDKKLEDGVMSHWSSGHYLISLFPAVRLALVAIGEHLGLRDPGARFMEARIQAHEVYKKHNWAYRYAQSDQPNRAHRQEKLEEALAALEKQRQRTPNDERVWMWLGVTLLFLDRPEEAEDLLQHSIEMPWCRNSILPSALYNLACAYARTGKEDECRTTLEHSLRLQSRSRHQLNTDPDFEAVRDKEWFHQLLVELQ